MVSWLMPFSQARKSNVDIRREKAICELYEGDEGGTHLATRERTLVRLLHVDRSFGAAAPLYIFDYGPAHFWVGRSSHLSDVNRRTATG